ncbi:MAG: TolC family protein [Desulfobacteraceae bacterium]|nr:TolC family protein [Desulfobacteraceae bacterium]
MQRTVFICIFLFTFAVSSWAKTVTIGVVTDGPGGALRDVFQVYRHEMKGLLEPEYDVRFHQPESFEGDWSVAGVSQALDAALTTPSVDVVLTFGMIASDVAIDQKQLSKPVIAPFIVAPDVQARSVKSGSNLNLITFPNKIQEELQLFQTLIGADDIAVLVDEAILKAIPELKKSAVFQQMARRSIDIIVAGGDVEKIIARLPVETDGVYITGLAYMSDKQFCSLTRLLNQKKIPTFSMVGLNDLDRGVLATAAGDFLERTARLTALNMQLILNGHPPDVLPATYQQESQLVINREVANAIGFETPYSLITEVAFVGDDSSGKAPALTLDEAVRMALRNNADVATAYYEIDENRQDIKLAQSRLLPSMTASAAGYQIDGDRAETSMGSQAERTLEGSLKLTQVVYAEKAWADVDIRKRLLEAKQSETQTTVYDVKESTATAYVDVLYARAVLEIQRENLKRSRQYLNLARLRESVGQAGSSEVYRWMNMIATSKQDVIEAMNRVEMAYTELNRLIGLAQSDKRPLEDLARRSHAVLGEDLSMLQERFNNPSDFRIFQDFMVEESLENAPEIKQLDAALKAYDRRLLSGKRAFYMPTVGFEAEVTQRFAESGAGQEGLSIPGMELPQADETDWSVALSLSYPLFEGGSKRATVEKSCVSLKRLKSERLAALQRIEQRVRTRMMQNHTSYSNIGLSREAASAADKSLALAQDAYQRGVGSILDLIDAQNASQVSNQLAATSIYQFYNDYIRTRRAAGRLGFDPAAEEIRCFRERMNYYMETQKYTPRCSGE